MNSEYSVEIFAYSSIFIKDECLYCVVFIAANLFNNIYCSGNSRRFQWSIHSAVQFPPLKRHYLSRTSVK